MHCVRLPDSSFIKEELTKICGKCVKRFIFTKTPHEGNPAKSVNVCTFVKDTNAINNAIVANLGCYRLEFGLCEGPNLSFSTGNCKAFYNIALRYRVAVDSH